MINKKIIILLSVLFLVVSCGTEVKESPVNDELTTADNALIEEIFVELSEWLDDENIEWGLSDAEKEGLILMREEEKLARDTYTYFYEKYGQNIFGNIDDSEEKHKSAVLPLLEKYNLEDPIKDDTPGVFTMPMLDNLYKDLITAWNVSLVEALKVGMTIEDLDIKDLNELLEGTEDEDIIRVYENLLKWSYNHLRAFKKNLDKKGWEYTPQFISQEEYDEILGN